MTDYEVWEFLRANPSESSVIENIGLPDSVWLSDNDSTKFLYYFHVFDYYVYVSLLYSYRSACHYIYDHQYRWQIPDNYSASVPIDLGNIFLISHPDN